MASLELPNTHSIPFEEDEEGNKGAIRPEEEVDEVTTVGGLRGLRFASCLIFIYWGVCIVLKHEQSALDQTIVKCGLTDAAFNHESVLEECLKQTAVFRVAAVVLLIFGCQLVVSLIWSTDLWDNFWLLVKLPFFTLSTFLLLYQDDSYAVTFFDDRVFAWIARFGAFAFVILQALIFLDWAYQFNESMLKSAMDAMGGGSVSRSMQRTFDGITSGSQTKTSMRLVLLLCFALVNLAGFIVAMSYLFSEFGGDGCSENDFILTVSTILVAIATVAQLSSSNGRGSVTTTGVLALYVAYTSYCAVSLNPRAECNNGFVAAAAGSGPAVLGILFSFLSVAYITLFAARKMASLIAAGPVPLSGMVSIVSGFKSSAAEYDKVDTVHTGDAASLRVIVLNLSCVFIFVTCYIAMVLTNWGSVIGFESVGAATDGLSSLATSVGSASVGQYLNACAGWITALLYILALCIPTWSDCIPTNIWALKFKVSN